MIPCTDKDETTTWQLLLGMCSAFWNPLMAASCANRTKCLSLQRRYPKGMLNWLRILCGNDVKNPNSRSQIKMTGMKKLELIIKRIAAHPDYTIGELYVNGTKLCDTMEATDRELYQSMPLEDLKEAKVEGKTAIPYGTYLVTMEHKSPKFSKVEYYKDFCEGYVPRLLRVHGFEGILILRGNGKDEAKGSVIVGENTSPGGLANSKLYWEKLMKDYLLPADRAESV